MKNITILLSVILLLTGCTKYYSFASNDKTKDTKKEYTLQTLKGKTIKVKGSRNFLEIQTKELQNQVILVNFWASWCPPCKAEIPHFVEMVDKYKGKFNIIGVLVRDEKSDKELQSFADKFKINYPITIGDENNRFAKDFMPAKYLPFSILYDKNGKYISNYVGLFSQETLENDIKKAMK